MQVSLFGDWRKSVVKVGSTVVLKDGTSVPLARRRKREFEARYKEYLMREK